MNFSSDLRLDNLLSSYITNEGNIKGKYAALGLPTCERTVRGRGNMKVIGKFIFPQTIFFQNQKTFYRLAIPVKLLGAHSYVMLYSGSSTTPKYVNGYVALCLSI